MNSSTDHSAPTAKSGQGNPGAQTGLDAERFDGVLAVSVERLAEITSVGRTFIYSEVKQGRLRLIKKGRRSLVLLDDARAWLQGSPPPSIVANTSAGGRQHE